MLHFFGKGSAFADDNTCAYFIDNNVLADNCLTVYTGDTKTPDPFMVFLKNSDTKLKFLYTEISVYKSDVHLFIDDNLNTLIDLQRQGIDVYLMHLDNEVIIREKIKDTDLRIVETI